jgi:hypothetical protein
MDTWVARDVWMGVPMRVLCACAVRVCGSACDGAAPATVRDVDQALAVAATIRTTACTCASSLHWDMHTLARACACHVLESDGFAPVTVCDADQALAVLTGRLRVGHALRLIELIQLVRLAQFVQSNLLKQFNSS